MTGHPNLQALVNAKGGYDRITSDDWKAFDASVAAWQARYRAELPRSGERAVEGKSR
jgi:hypothetical protein